MNETTANSLVDVIAIVRLHSTPITVSECNQPTESSNVSNDPPPTKMCALETFWVIQVCVCTV